MTLPAGGELIILGIVVLLFGDRKLPELARSMGTSVKELRAAAQEEQDGASLPAAERRVATDGSRP